ncbi:MAG TPA: MlaD family protein [Solirubrobacterales bacterium]|jgi:virulence factor Mce-like protein|nr:MlaD family protein [Solirubrobacterales bacterium]
MSKRAPSTTQLLVIAGFALSCFGILLFLWITFGGPTPFKAKPYEIEIPFNEATQLAQQSDVRISGVSVGKVQEIVVAPNGKQALAKVDIDDKYGPIPRGTRAILRTKTLLGETYIELTPGDRNGPVLPDGGTLPAAQIAESVQLDEIFRTFDPRTRAAFQTWQQEASVAIAGRGADLSYAFGELEPAFTQFDHLFRVLDSQRLAVKQLFRNGATSLRALRGRQGELAGLIRNSNAVFSTTAARDHEIEALFRAFPTFEDESRLTLERLKTFSVDADPVMRQLVPVAEQLSPTLIALSKFAPQAKGLFEGLKPVIARAPTGFPALRKLFRDQFPPLLRAVDPFLRNLNPIVTGLGLYKHELTSTMANVAAISNATLPTNAAGENVHYLRAMGPFNPESLATFPSRTNTSRTNAYPQPLGSKALATGLPSFDTRGCGAGVTATLDPETPNNPVFKARTEQSKKTAAENEKLSKTFFERLKKFAFAEQTDSAAIGAPGCIQQAPFAPVGRGGAATAYQHYYAEQGE